MKVPLTPLYFYRRAASLYRNKTAVVDGEVRLTYRELAERIERLAGALAARGVRNGDRVSFICFNTHQLLEAYYGVPLVGGVLNPINVRLAPQEIAYIINHAGSRILFFHQEYAPLVDSIRGELKCVERFVVIEGAPGALSFPAEEYESLLGSATPLSPDITNIDEDAPIEQFYTSGTTALPKGVILTHRNIYLHAVHAIISLGLREDDAYLHIVPMYHANGWGTPQTLTAIGAKHVMLRKVDPQTVFELIEREQVTICMGVPTVFNMLVNFPEIDKYDTSSLRLSISGGSPVSLALIQAVEAKMGGRCVQAYGLTETSPLLTLAFPKSYLGATDEERQQIQATTGHPVLGVELRVVDAEGRDVPPDGETMGEIAVRGNGVMGGYYQDENATADAIRDGWFYTGDIATIDEEGYVVIKDRRKDIIISGGINISSAEIENTLYAHPAVFQCAVIGVPHERWGETPKAIVVLKPNASATEQELIDFCRERMARYKAPSSVEFVASLPISGTGKILKRELREQYWAGYEKRVH